MTTTNTGGLAFPQIVEIAGPAFDPIKQKHVPEGSKEVYVEGGMTLRDYFAAKAMQGMLAHATRYRPRPGAPTNWHCAISQEAYEIADAMLVESAK